jgi:2,5-diketo-D-gluconate reductase B
MGIDDPAAIADAIDCGYRHLDTAQIYDNEAVVGEGIDRAARPRSDLFVATKLWVDRLGADRVRPSTRESLDRLGVETADLLYVHRPRGEYDPASTLPALAACRDDGLTRHVGLSNFTLDEVETAMDYLGGAPFAHQVEFHPLFRPEALLDHARSEGYTLVAYSPLAGGRVFDLPELVEVAERHDTSPAAVSIAWLRGKEGVVTIPKAGSPAHRRANLAAADLELDEDDVATIESVDRERELYPE